MSIIVRCRSRLFHNLQSNLTRSINFSYTKFGFVLEIFGLGTSAGIELGLWFGLFGLVNITGCSSKFWMRKIHLANIFLTCIFQLRQDNIRVDGRGCEDYRFMELETDLNPHCSGSARLRLVNTKITTIASIFFWLLPVFFDLVCEVSKLWNSLPVIIWNI